MKEPAPVPTRIDAFNGLLDCLFGFLWRASSPRLACCWCRPTRRRRRSRPLAPRTATSTGPIAFVSDRDGTDRIYLANEDGSLVTPLVAGGSPAWAKDGRQIAFSARGSDIRVIGVDGSGDRVIAVSGLDPAWSPDGQSLVFVNWRAGDDSALERRERRRLEPAFPARQRGSGVWSPKWSPDGQRVLFYISDGYYDWCFGLWTVNADGSDARQLGGPGRWSSLRAMIASRREGLPQ